MFFVFSSVHFKNSRFSLCTFQYNPWKETDREFPCLKFLHLRPVFFLVLKTSCSNYGNLKIIKNKMLQQEHDKNMLTIERLSKKALNKVQLLKQQECKGQKIRQIKVISHIYERPNSYARFHEIFLQIMMLQFIGRASSFLSINILMNSMPSMYDAAP